MASPGNASRASYFVVVLAGGREVPMLYWDELPRAPIRNLIYVVRLDQLPNGPQLLELPLLMLYDMFCHLRKAKKLPARWEPPPRKTETGPAKLKPGHREYHARRFMPDPPYDPHH